MNATFRRLKHELKTEKRKVGTLAVLALVGLLLWGKLLIPTGTERASGQDSVTAQPDGSGETGEADNGPIPAPPEPEVVQVALRERVRRDPFQLRRDRYEPTRPQTPDSETDQEKQEQERQRRRAIRAEAEQLELQSTLIGQQPQAIINGRLVAVGQTINGFRLLEVRSREARLVKQGVELTLKIRSD